MGEFDPPMQVGDGIRADSIHLYFVTDISGDLFTATVPSTAETITRELRDFELVHQPVRHWREVLKRFHW
ncbi:MAG: hypothetical protein Rubg2KO_15360 [Rubricoccaceae bacterium]